MSYITTWSGVHFDPVHPDPELIRIEDIAHSLSLLCRANGHFKYFYTVAQHSIACAREAKARSLSRRVQLACLLHDAAEAFLSDVTRPVKALLPEYSVIEDRLLDTIWEKYLGSPVTKEEREAVFEIDDDMLSLEFKEIMPEELGDRYRKLKAEIRPHRENEEDVEKEFLRLFDELKD
ncbi:MAG: phosphohydrolase [Erysipelotrichales bacterium]|nr:phosphohydrolase [Erysipelotrichales bacterium]